MYAGRVVEEGTLDEIFYDPQHPYTWGLLGSLTRLDRPRPQAAAADQRRAAVAALAADGVRVPAALPARVRQVRASCRRSRRGCPTRPRHCDRCWLEPEQKREKRQVAGQIGLEAPA